MIFLSLLSFHFIFCNLINELRDFFFLNLILFTFFFLLYYISLLINLWGFEFSPTEIRRYWMFKRLIFIIEILINKQLVRIQWISIIQDIKGTEKSRSHFPKSHSEGLQKYLKSEFQMCQLCVLVEFQFNLQSWIYQFNMAEERFVDNGDQSSVEKPLANRFVLWLRNMIIQSHFWSIWIDQCDFFFLNSWLHTYRSFCC